MSPRESVLRTLLINLRTGLRIGLLRRFAPDDLRADIRQVVLLFVVAFGLSIGSEFIYVEPERVFEKWGVVSELAGYALVLLAAYLAAQIQGRLERFGLLVVAMLAAYPAALAVSLAYQAVLESDIGRENLWLAWGAFALVLIWSFAVYFRAQLRLFGTGWKRTAVATGVYLGVLVTNSLLLPQTEVWYTAYDDYEDETPELDVEATYYAQPALVEAALEGLQPQRPGIPDIYFVGVAGYADQDVFLREVHAVRELFDSRFDTVGRSVLLINNPATVGEVPLANGPNLQRVLGRIGEMLDPEEDLLFLYMTSHGSEEHELAMEFWPLSVNYLPAQRLGEILDSSDIGWRAVVVSACYSGGFISPLQDARTMVLTAAAADKQSFGCSNENAWTYFGEAYFDQALRRQHSFVAAFDEAAKAIAARESREELEPSLPQAWVGEEIAAFLPEVERRLAGLDEGGSATVVGCGGVGEVWGAACR